jgi:NADPH:quinone reductase-like Zn-dependent oxidoreductase
VPKPDEVRVRIRASTVNRTDTGFRSGSPWLVRLFAGVRSPRFGIWGNEFAGEVDAVGAAVTAFAVGDRVFGVDQVTFGKHAEASCVRQDRPMARIPDGLGFEEAAATPDGFILGMTIVRWAGVRADQEVLVHGAAGSIGSAVVQIAHDMGARVIAVCGPQAMDLVRTLGADEVIDRRAHDFTLLGRSWDAVIDAVGKLSFAHCRPAVAPGGRYVTTDLGPYWQNPLLALGTAVTGRLGTQRVQMPLPRYRQQEVGLLREMLATGRYRPVIDRRYPLEETVEATRYVESGHKTGNVVLTIHA